MRRWLILALLGSCRPAAPPPRGQAAASDAQVVVQPAVAAPPVADETTAPLEEEVREPDPTSEKVKLKLWVYPVTALVSWGAKKLGEAGKEPLEIERPRSSGPLDLLVRADGYLPFHTRVFTDRDEKLTVRLVRVEDAPGLLGYRAPAARAR